MRASGAQSRLDVAAIRGLTPLVGREQEVGLLLERWTQAREGLGQVVVLSGEAGIGKSRLVQVLKEQVARSCPSRMECRCSPYYQHTALVSPHRAAWSALLHLAGTSAVAPAGATGTGPAPIASPGRAVPLFAALLSLPVPATTIRP